MEKSSQDGKTVYLDKVGIFWNQKDGRIRITAQGIFPFISTVSPDPKSKRGNPNLYYKLAKCLQAKGAPHPPIPSD